MERITVDREMTLPEAHVNAALAQFKGELPADESEQRLVAELEVAGLLREGVLAPRLAELVEVIAAPVLKISLEMLGPWGAEVDLVWMGPHLVVVGTSDGDCLRLAPLDPVFLVADLARRVGLRNRIRRTPPGLSERVSASVLAELQAMMGQEGGTEIEELRRKLLGWGVAPEWQMTLVDVVAHRWLSWRLVSEWSDDEGQERRELAVLDGGSAGLFLVGSADDDAVRLTSVSASDVLRQIRWCLPPTRSDQPTRAS